MAKIRHIAIFGQELSGNSPFFKQLLKGIVPPEFQHLEGKKGALFSEYTLEKYIKEEALHDIHALSSSMKRSIRTYSNGEQKKALLKYLLSLRPEFLLLESAFDMLDKKSVTELNHRLTSLSKEIPILQIVKRKDNLLSFMDHFIQMEKEKIIFSGSIGDYSDKFLNNREFKLKGKLPEPLGEQTEVTDPLVEFRDVSVKYGEKEVLRDIYWTINKGDFWQLTGPNGSGKTTLLTMITGDNPKAYGQDIILFGRKRGTGESIWDIKKRIGYVTPSMTVLFRGWNTVEKMVISGLVDSVGLYQKPTELQRSIADKWIDLMGMGSKALERFSNLNEGQQCMVLIARSMIKHPPLLILDEPAHGLDDYQTSVLTAFINKIAEEGQTTIIFVSHRDEPGLRPGSVFELIPSQTGSTGRIR